MPHPDDMKPATESIQSIIASLHSTAKGPRTIVATQRDAELMSLADRLQEYKRNARLLIEYHAIEAKITRKRFLSLRAEGFTDAQAIELCK